jgi:hypothetical protein
MQTKSAVLIAALLAGCGAEVSTGVTPLEGPQTYTSHFGFTVQVPGQWLVLSPKQASAANAEETLRSLGVNTEADQRILRGILQRVQTGKIEFYLERQTLNSEFQNNISAQLMPGRGPLTEDLVTEMCRDISSQLSPMFGGATVDVRACGLERYNNVSYISYEYAVPAQTYYVLQDEIPFVNDSTLVVVGGTLDATAMKRIKDMQRVIVSGAIAFAAERPTSGSSGPVPQSEASR